MFRSVSFYSFKGGAGRSTTCLNTIPYIFEIGEASSEHPIVLLDVDLDSAGMTYLLEQENFFHENYDIKEFLKGDNDLSVPVDKGIQNHPFYKKLVPVGNKFGIDDNNAVMFLGINDRMKLGNNDFSGEKDELFNKLRKFCKNNGISALVFDTPTGDQITAKFSLKASNCVVCCMKNTMQFRKGTFNYLKRIAAEVDINSLVIFPTVVPKDLELDGVSQMENSINSIKQSIQDLSFEDINTDFVSKDMFGINEIERFKWKEDILYKLEKKGELRDDEKEGINRYKKLAEIVIGE